MLWLTVNAIFWRMEACRRTKIQNRSPFDAIIPIIDNFQNGVQDAYFQTKPYNEAQINSHLLG